MKEFAKCGSEVEGRQLVVKGEKNGDPPEAETVLDDLPHNRSGHFNFPRYIWERILVICPGVTPLSKLTGEGQITKLLGLSAMVRKIDWDKVLTALKTTCSKCGRLIKQNEINRASLKEMICPACGAIFDPLEKAKPDPSPRV